MGFPTDILEVEVDSYTFDLQRIFIGDLPILFLVEIALRTTILYLYSLGIIRVLGQRSAGQLTPVDVVVIVALGSCVGDPMFYPNVPILHGLVVITLIVGLQRLGLYWANHHEKIDRWIKGNPSLVVVNGVLNLDKLANLGISKRELFQLARQKGYRQLGEIRRMYIERDEKPSIYGFAEDQVRPGLPFEPPWEVEGRPDFQTGSRTDVSEVAACTNCGQTARFEAGDKVPPCPHCHQTDWVFVG